MNAASRVFAGVTPPAVEAENRGPHADPFADPAQAVRALASEFNFDVEIVTLEGTPAPGEVPILRFTRLVAVSMAFVNPWAFVELAPTSPPRERNGDNAHAEATVVTSLITINVSVVVVTLHGPTGAISNKPGFADVAEDGLPPSAIRYSALVGEGHAYVIGTLNAPFAFVVIGLDSRGVGDEPFPVVPAA